MGIGASFIYNGQVFKTGDKVTCRIHNKFIDNAKIYVLSSCAEDRYYWFNLDYAGTVIAEAYICQNLKHGSAAPDSLGYAAGWVFTVVDNNGNIELTEDVSELKLNIKDELANIVQLAFSPQPEQRG
jgi:hypothetical protein